MDEPEQKVTERTRELSQVNAQLRSEVNERERMERELVRAQKLEALGQLVAGIAHEINNPLGVILSNRDFIGDELKRQPKELASSLAEIGDVLRETSGGAERIRHIVADLKTFCRTDESPPEPLDVQQVIESSLIITHSDLNKVAAVKKEFAAVPQVLANGSRLGQLILNLLINAIQAMTADKRSTNVLMVRTRRLVVDTGSGISPETLKKIFNPFFTTKPLGNGTGLGLSICHGIVEAFGGTIEVESAVGAGTTMRVLPRAVEG